MSTFCPKLRVLGVRRFGFLRSIAIHTDPTAASIEFVLQNRHVFFVVPFMDERIQASSIPPPTFMTCFPANGRTRKFYLEPHVFYTLLR